MIENRTSKVAFDVLFNMAVILRLLLKDYFSDHIPFIGLEKRANTAMRLISIEKDQQM